MCVHVSARIRVLHILPMKMGMVIIYINILNIINIYAGHIYIYIETVARYRRGGSNVFPSHCGASYRTNSSGN